MVAKDILRVFYAPHKVFKDLVQKAGYLGPFILLIVFLVAQVGSTYVTASRLYIEETWPNGVNADEWTENTSLWMANSGVAITRNTADFINGTQVFADFPDYYGNSSIEFAVSNSSLLQIALGNFGNVDCGANGFKEVVFRVKIVTPDAKPTNVTLFLYSLGDIDFFYYDLTSAFSDNVNVWNNISVPVGSGEWLSSGSPSWENITSLKLDFAWSSDSNIDLRLDGLFFRGRFIAQIEREGGPLPFLANWQRLVGLAAPFVLEWFLLTGLMYLLIKWLKGNVVWKPLMVAVGYALVIIVVQAFIVAAVYTTLSDLNYPLEILAYVSGEFEATRDILLNQLATVNMVSTIIQGVAWIWLIALGAFITRAITGDKKIAEHVSMGKVGSDTSVSSEATEFSWMKCLLVSGASLFLTILVLGLFGIA